MNKDNALKLFHKDYDGELFISSPFGYRKSPITGKDELHNGVDYSEQGNSVPVYGLEDGIVLAEGKDSSGAIFCYVHYPRIGYVGLYYHLNNTDVSKNDKVTKDTKIGMIGKTGNVTGIHLHFSWFKYTEYSKPFNSRTYEDYNAYNFETVTPTVERDENIPQVKVLADNLRVRADHNTNSQEIGYAVKNGVYNDLETYNDRTYTWHRISEGQWVADNGTWLELYPVLDYKTLYEEQLKINEELSKQNDILGTECRKQTEIIEEVNKLTTI